MHLHFSDTALFYTWMKTLLYNCPSYSSSAFIPLLSIHNYNYQKHYQVYHLSVDDLFFSILDYG